MQFEHDSASVMRDVVSIVINALVALGTLGLAYLAARPLIFRPKLKIRLRERTFFQEIIDGRPNRFLHITAENWWRRATVTGVRVYLRQIDRLHGGAWETIFETGNVALQWQFEGARRSHLGTPYVVDGLTVPPDQICDLGRVIDGQGFRFELVHGAAGLNDVEQLLSSPDRETIRVHLFAQGTNSAPSNTLIIELSWDGVYAQDDTEMSRHFSFKEV